MPSLPRAGALAVAALLSGTLLTGCVDGGREPAPPATPEASASDAPATPVTTASPTADGTPPVLLLQPDGLGLLQDDGTVDALGFGTARQPAVLDALDDLLGDGSTGPVDCGSGPRTALLVDGFVALFAPSGPTDVLVGWADRGAADRSETTPDGVGTGSSLQELQSALPGVVVTPVTGGATWSDAGGLKGSLDGVDPTSRITTMAAGQSCDDPRLAAGQSLAPPVPGASGTPGASATPGPAPTPGSGPSSGAPGTPPLPGASPLTTGP